MWDHFKLINGWTKAACQVLTTKTTMKSHANASLVFEGVKNSNHTC